MIGYQLDLKNKAIRVKPKKLEKYRVFWGRLRGLTSVTVDDWAKMTGRLLFAGSFDDWIMFDLKPWYEAFKPVIRKAFGYLPKNWCRDRIWETMRSRQLLVPLTNQMIIAADRILELAPQPHCALYSVLRDFDGPPALTVCTDASLHAMGGCRIASDPEPWFYCYENVDGLESIAGIPIPRRMLDANDTVPYAQRYTPEMRTKTKPHIGVLEFIAVCAQIRIITDELDGVVPDKPIITVVGDNMGVLGAINRKRSTSGMYDPFLRWLEKEIRGKFRIVAVYCDTKKIPSDVLSRPQNRTLSDAHIDEFTTLGHQLARYENFDECIGWDYNTIRQTDFNRMNSTVRAVWQEISMIALQLTIWQ